MSDVKSTVEKILGEFPTARNSDKQLMIMFMQQYGMRLSQEQVDIFRSMPSLESARRERQKFQERGLYPATKEVKKNRSRMEQEIGQRIPTTKPQDTSKLFNVIEGLNKADNERVKRYVQSYEAQTLFDILPKRND